MNDIGFISSDIMTIGNIIPVSNNIDRWDHQTVVLLVNDDNIDTVMRSFNLGEDLNHYMRVLDTRFMDL